METLGITWTQADIAALAEQALAYALPRIALTSGLFVLAFLLHRAAGWILERIMDRVIKRTRMNVDDIVFRCFHRALILSICSGPDGARSSSGTCRAPPPSSWAAGSWLFSCPWPASCPSSSS